MNYKVNDVVRTKFGAGQIRKIWSLNKNITVFEVYLYRERKVKSMFFGELDGKVEFVYQYKIIGQVR